jgi:hypothetical protein
VETFHKLEKVMHHMIHKASAVGKAGVRTVNKAKKEKARQHRKAVKAQKRHAAA